MGMKTKKIEDEYVCNKCHREPDSDSVGMRCSCGGRIIALGFPAIGGTRDQFGISRAFKDEGSGKTIDNWKSWERAGYRNPLETVKDKNVREGIKRKMDKIKHEKNKGEWNG